jgi:hypothetical protein
MIEALRYLIVEQMMGREIIVEVSEMLANGYSPSEVASKLNISKNFVRSIKCNLTIRGAKGVYLNYLAKYMPSIKSIKPTTVKKSHYECVLCGERYRDATAMYLHIMRSHGEVVDEFLRRIMRMTAVKFINPENYK